MIRPCRSTANSCAATPTARSDNAERIGPRDSGNDHRAAADADYLTGDVRGHIARQEQGEVRNLARLTETAHGIALLGSFEHPLRVNSFQELVVDNARCDRVNPNSFS